MIKRQKTILYILISMIISLSMTPVSFAAARNITVEIKEDQESFKSGDALTVVIKIDDATDIVHAELELEYNEDIFEFIAPENIHVGYKLGGENPPIDGMFGYMVTDGVENYLPSSGRDFWRVQNVSSHMALCGTAVGEDGGGKHTGEQILFEIPFKVNASYIDYSVSYQEIPIVEGEYPFIVRQKQQCDVNADWHNDMNENGRCDNHDVEGLFIPALIGAVRNTDQAKWNDLQQAYFHPEINYTDVDETIYAQVDVHAKPTSMIIVLAPDTHAYNNSYWVEIEGTDGPFEYRYKAGGEWSEWQAYSSRIRFGKDQEDGTSMTYYFEARIQGQEDVVVSEYFTVDKLEPELIFSDQYGTPIESGDDDEPKQNKDWYLHFNEADCSLKYIVTQDANPPDPWEDFYLPLGGALTRMVVKGGVDGKWYVHAAGKDSAGNESNSVSGYAYLDNTPPTAPSITSANPGIDTGLFAPQTISLTWNPSTDEHNGLEADGIAGYAWVIDTQSHSEPGDMFETDLPDTVELTQPGSHYIHVAAKDKAGNLSEVYHYGPWTMSGMGDINGDYTIDIEDAILVLRTLAGEEPSASVNVLADVDGDGAIGLAELVYILRVIAEL